MSREILVDLDQGRVQTRPYEGTLFAKELAVQRLIEAEDPDRLLVISGFTPLAGAGFALAGKLGLYGTSLLGNNLQGSRSGGLAGRSLARMGIVSVLVRGQADTPCLLVLLDGQEPRLEPLSDYGDHIAGTDALATAIRARHGHKLALALTDPSTTGFRFNALVCNHRVGGPPDRAAARSTTRLGHNGWLGMVLPSSPAVGHALDPRPAREALRQAARRRRNPNLVGSADPASPLLGGTWGAAAEARLALGHGLTNLFRDAHLPDEVARAVLPEVLVREQLARAETSGLGPARHGCMPGCPNKCSQVALVPDGKGSYRQAKAGEWETLQGVLNLGLFEAPFDLAAHILAHSNRYAWDHIEGLVALAALALASEAGSDTGVYYGDEASVLGALDQAVRGDTDLGQLLRLGTAAIEAHYGLERHFTVGGHALPFHNGRAVQQTGIGLSWTYGRHGESCAGPGRHNVLGRPWDPLDREAPPEEHVLNTIHGMVLYGALDGLGMCFFAGPSLATLVELAPISALLGHPLEPAAAIRRSAQTLQQVHAFNAARGVHIEPLPRVFSERATHGNAQEEDEAVRFDIPWEVVRDHGAHCLDELASGAVQPLEMAP